MWAHMRGSNRGWRKMHNEEIYNLYSQPNISMIKRKTRWVRHTSCLGEMRNIHLSGRHHLEELGTNGRIIFKWNLKD
jgi:hypothetical protein